MPEHPGASSALLEALSGLSDGSSDKPRIPVSVGFKDAGQGSSAPDTAKEPARPRRGSREKEVFQQRPPGDARDARRIPGKVTLAKHQVGLLKTAVAAGMFSDQTKNMPEHLRPLVKLYYNVRKLEKLIENQPVQYEQQWVDEMTHILESAAPPAMEWVSKNAKSDASKWRMLTTLQVRSYAKGDILMAQNDVSDFAAVY